MPWGGEATVRLLLMLPFSLENGRQCGRRGSVEEGGEHLKRSWQKGEE